MASEPDALQDEIARRTTQGWQVVSRGANDAQMRRPKRFSLVWAFLWLLVFGVGILVYLFWHWAKRDELIFLQVTDGQPVVTGERRGLLRVLFAPFRAWWRWAGERQTKWAKALAYSSPILGVLLLFIVIGIIGTATGAGGRDEEAESAAAQPTQAAGAATQTADQEVAQPTATPEPTEEKTERIVTAVPGAVAQAEGVRITLNEIVDPWVDPSEFGPHEPDPGKRFVALDVTIQYVRESGRHFVCGNFRLTDTDDFAYDRVLGFEVFYLDASLDCINLGGGERTRGWIGFQVNAGTPLKLLKYDPNIFTTDDIEFQFQ